MKNTKAYILLILTTIIWGSMYVFSKYVFLCMNPLVLLFWRFLFGFALLFIFYLITGGKIKDMRIKKSDFKYIFIIGFCGYFIGIGFQLLGTDYCDASLASLINSINPVVIIVLGFIILKEKVNKKQILSVCIALTGTILIVGQIEDMSSILGALISFGAVLFWSLGSVIVRFVSNNYNSLVITIWSMLLGAIFSLPASIYKSIQTPFMWENFDAMFVFSFLFICIISTAVSFLFWNKSLGLVSAATCSMFYPIQPLVSAVLGVILLGEQITLNFLIGGSLIIFAVLFSVYPSKKKNNVDKSYNR